MTRWGKVLGGAAVAVLAPLACANLDGLAGGGASGPGPGDGSADSAIAADSGITSATAGFSISVRQLSFPFDCSQADGPKSGDLTLKNDSDAPISFELTLDSSPTFAFADTTVVGDAGLTGVVPAHGTFPVQIVAKGLPKSASETATLHVHTGDFDDVVQLTATADGARLTIDPALADFGFVRQNVVSEPLSVVVTNTGSRPATVTGFAPPASDFSLPASLVVPPGGSVTSSVTMTAGNAGSPIDTTVTPTVAAPLCGQAPSVQLKGQRVASDLIVSPVTVDFGQLGCNTSPTSQLKVTITNYSATNAATYTTNLPASSKFTIVSGASGSLPKASSGAPSKAEITVGVKPTGTATGDFNETLGVTVLAATETTTNVSLHVRSYGAKIAFLTPNLDWNRNQTKSAGVLNNGNATACVTYNIVSAEPQTPFSVQATGNLAPSPLPTGVAVTFNASDGKDHTATVHMTAVACAGASAPAPLCNPLPELPLHGNK